MGWGSNSGLVISVVGGLCWPFSISTIIKWKYLEAHDDILQQYIHFLVQFILMFSSIRTIWQVYERTGWRNIQMSRFISFILKLYRYLHHANDWH